MTDLKKTYGIEMWPDEKVQNFRKDIMAWYDVNKRDLPWRATKAPYNIWISEIMAQQTQVGTVIPYYERFLEKFPDVETLAVADEVEVLKMWEGLGYYSRARNIHTAAKQVVADYGGELPKTRKELETLRGIGPYTASAIASMAFNEVEPAIDGNAMRVFGRIFEIEDDITRAKTKRLYEDLVRHLIDEDRPGDFNQAIMDIGATKSMPKVYDPENNPVAIYDESYKKGTWANYPVKKKAKPPKDEVYFGVAVQDAGEFYLRQRPSQGLLANMWTYPLIPAEVLLGEEARALKPTTKNTAIELGTEDYDRLESYLSETEDLKVEIKPEILGNIQHVFSHLHWTVYVLEAELLAGKSEDKRHAWVMKEDFDEYVFPKAQQKIVDLLKTNE